MLNKTKIYRAGEEKF